MILTKKEILKRIKLGDLKITPFSKSSVGPATIDLTLGKTIRVFNDSVKPITLNVGMESTKETKKVSLKNGYILSPGEFVLGITEEKVTLPSDLCAWLHSRSRFARFGLMSHATAPFLSPGINNKQILEIYNAGPREIVLKAGIKICHIILQECLGTATYSGKFKNQKL